MYYLKVPPHKKLKNTAVEDGKFFPANKLTHDKQKTNIHQVKREKSSYSSQSYQTLIISFFLIFAFKLGRFKEQTLFSNTTNTQA